MLSAQDTKKTISLKFKRLFDDNGKIVINGKDGQSPPTSQVAKKPKLAASTPSLLCTDETLDSFDDFPSAPVISLAKPKVPSPQKQKSPPKHGVIILDNEQQIIAWITKNKRFLASSFSGELDEWVKKKLISQPSFVNFKEILEEFIEEFHINMQSKRTVDVRKLDPGTRMECEDLFPDVYACFIDAIKGLTYDLVRNEDVLPNRKNNVLMEFLLKNRLVAECLAYGLPTLNGIAELWVQEHPVVDLWSSSHPLSESTKKPTLKLAPISPVKTSGKENSPKKVNASSTNNLKNGDTIPNLAASLGSLFSLVNNDSGSLSKPLSIQALGSGQPAATQSTDVPAMQLPAILRRSSRKKFVM